MSDKPKRSWFRFRLLTAVLMMVVAGGVLWVNTRVFRSSESHVARGWPFEYWRRALPWGYDPETGFTQKYPGFPGFPGAGAPAGFERYSSLHSKLPIALAVGVDVTVVFSILFAVAFVSESLIRGREGRKS